MVSPKRLDIVSLCCTIGPPSLPILNVIVGIYQPQTPHLSQLRIWPSFLESHILKQYVLMVPLSGPIFTVEGNKGNFLVFDLFIYLGFYIFLFQLIYNNLKYSFSALMKNTSSKSTNEPLVLFRCIGPIALWNVRALGLWRFTSAQGRMIHKIHFADNSLEQRLFLSFLFFLLFLKQYVLQCGVSFRCSAQWFSSIFLSIYVCKYLSTYLPIYLPMYLCIYVSICISIYLYTYLSTYLSVFLSMYLRIYLYIYISIYLPTYLPMYLCIYLSTYLYTYVPTYLPIYLSIYLHFSRFFPP